MLAPLTRIKSGARHRPEGEGTGKPLQFYTVVPLPLQLLVAPRAEYFDIRFGLLAELDLCTFDRPDDTGGEVHCPAEDITLFDLQGADMDTRSQPEIRRAGVGG